jgi:5'-nucleotidase
MRILLSNDDGIQAPGIQSLFKHLKQENNVTAVAPHIERSTTGQSLSLDTPIRINAVDENQFSCSGFPADCVLVGLAHIYKDNKPDLVVSGINKGANLGQDMYYSGTVAAAREASFHGVKSIAISLCLEADLPGEHFDSAAKFVAKVIADGIAQTINEQCLININVPNLPYDEIKGVKMGSVGFRKYTENIERREDARGREYFWIGGNYTGFATDSGKTDCEIVDSGFISITPHYLTSFSEKNSKELESFIQKIKLK